jgi:cell division protein FtsI/penicillin-binding protein 2
VKLRRGTIDRRTISHRELVRRRSVLILILVFLVFAVLTARLYSLQVINHARFCALADEYHKHSRSLAALRGSIKDRNGVCLASSERGYSVNARSDRIDDPALVAESLAPLLAKPEAAIARKLRTASGVVQLSPWVSCKTARMIWNLDLDGIELSPSFHRVYPAGELACHLIGICDTDCNGIEGIELASDDVLRGKPGRISGDVEARTRGAGLSFIPDRTLEYTEPENGRDLRLTIDSQIQRIVEEELEAGLDRCKAKSGSCVVLDPSTGEVLAVATVPRRDLNDASWRSGERLRLRAVADLFEPGSTLKPFCLAAAWRSNALPSDFSYTCSGNKAVGNKTISCAPHGEFRHGHGRQDARGIVVHSCNCGIATIAEAVGWRGYRDTLVAFGFDRRTGISIPGEPDPMMPPRSQWRPIRLANVAFGQGIAVTPLQLANAYCAFANGGILLEPRIIASLDDPDGGTEAPTKPKVVQRAVSEKIADEMMEVLTDVVESGTGKSASLDEYSVAGKTGTAQKAVGGTYTPGLYVSSFVGIVPASAPRAVILVVYDEPTVGRYGAEVAAPVFKRIAEATMKCLKVPPDRVRPGDRLAAG